MFDYLLKCPKESYLKILQTKSEQNPTVANDLAYLYAIGGIGVGTVDEKKTFELYYKATKGGITVGMWNLGNCYLNGKEVEESKELAMAWFEKAAKNGDEVAANYLKKIESVV